MDPTKQPMSARRQIRLAVMRTLRGIADVTTVASPGDWPTPPEKLPALLVNAPTESKRSLNKGMAAFTTAVSIVIQGQVQSKTAEGAQDAIEDLVFWVENAILTSYWLTRIIEQFSSVQTEVECKADGSAHLAGFRMTIVAETFESFDATAVPPDESAWPPADPTIAPLTSVGIHLDMADPFDATGTYASPAFPDAVLPAPRTSGPDGRDEGALDIQLPQ
ncbi:hypothetical protein [Variovorax sp. N23]|uniref:hypothetical protein n=1 Tax=Variovorax sp. N23 TaxID=2980555 RepID=UPI0021C98A45|nr:hypothetical protein [Variovorax sp. N23]MCU4119302.1 hypothetical protein [Variovorax sp. N23]